MQTLKIIKYPNDILRKKAVNISDPKNPEIQKLIKGMIQTMKKAQGIGLAAPQIGKSVRLCVVKDENEVLVLINPKITSFSREKISMLEGCLSFPNKYQEVERSEKIKVRYVDTQGNKNKIKATGITARIIQHEIDHLNGILLIDN